MSSTTNPFTEILQSLANKFESTAQELHNKAYDFWNTVSNSLTPKDVEKAFDREFAADELKKAVQEPDTHRLIHAQLPFHFLGALQQDYSRRYLSSRRHALVCTGNHFDRLSRDLDYMYTSESSPEIRDNTATDFIEAKAIEEA
jgi:hypothetical protein